MSNTVALPGTWDRSNGNCCGPYSSLQGDNLASLREVLGSLGPRYQFPLGLPESLVQSMGPGQSENINANKNKYTHIYMYAYTYINIHIHICVYNQMDKYMCIYIYI